MSNNNKNRLKIPPRGVLLRAPKFSKEAIIAMPDSVRKALGLPSNSEDNAGLKYRKLKESA